MILINGTKFWDKPGSCGTCPFFISGSSRLSPSDRGVCTLWNENHRTYTNETGGITKELSLTPFEDETTKEHYSR